MYFKHFIGMTCLTCLINEKIIKFYSRQSAEKLISDVREVPGM